MIPPRYLLWVDCLAGLVVGLLMFALSGWLSRLYQLPHTVVLAIASANVAYGTYSLSLATGLWRPRFGVTALAAANATWVLVCIAGLIAYRNTASIFGLAQFVLEALFVGWLAVQEWTKRREITGHAS